MIARRPKGLVPRLVRESGVSYELQRTVSGDLSDGPQAAPLRHERHGFCNMRKARDPLQISGRKLEAIFRIERVAQHPLQRTLIFRLILIRLAPVTAKAVLSVPFLRPAT